MANKRYVYESSWEKKKDSSNPENHLSEVVLWKVGCGSGFSQALSSEFTEEQQSITIVL